MSERNQGKLIHEYEARDRLLYQALERVVGVGDALLHDYERLTNILRCGEELNEDDRVMVYSICSRARYLIAEFDNTLLDAGYALRDGDSHINIDLVKRLEQL